MLLALLSSLKKRSSDLPQMAWGLAGALFVNRLGVMVKLFMALYLREVLGFSIDTIGWLLACSGAGLLLGSYAIGVLSDHMPTGKLAVWLMFASGVLLLSLTLFESAWLLALLLFLSGVCDGGARPLNQRLIMENCSLAERPRAQALNRVAVNLAVAIAGVLGGVLAHWDYRWVFVVSASMSFSAAFWLHCALGRWGVVPLAAVPSAESDGLLSPYSDKPFMAFLLVGVMLGLAYETVNSMLGNYLLDFYQLGAGALGWQFTINGLLVVALQIPLTRATEHWGERGQLALGSVLLALGLGMLPFGVEWGFTFVCFSTAIWTIGEILFMPTMSVLVMQRAEGRKSGHYFGLYGVCWSISMLISPVFGSQIYSHFGGHSVWFACSLLAILAVPLMDRAVPLMDRAALKMAPARAVLCKA